MDVQKVLVELRAYRTQLDETIGVLERLAQRRGEKLSRPLEMLPALETRLMEKAQKRKVRRRKQASA